MRCRHDAAPIAAAIRSVVRSGKRGLPPYLRHPKTRRSLPKCCNYRTTDDTHPSNCCLSSADNARVKRLVHKSSRRYQGTPITLIFGIFKIPYYGNYCGNMAAIACARVLATNFSPSARPGVSISVSSSRHLSPLIHAHPYLTCAAIAYT
jgi:hypothetical protein